MASNSPSDEILVRVALSRTSAKESIPNSVQHSAIWAAPRFMIARVSPSHTRGIFHCWPSGFNHFLLLSRLKPLDSSSFSAVATSYFHQPMPMDLRISAGSVGTRLPRVARAESPMRLGASESHG